MTIPATESSPNDHLPLSWQWSAGEYNCFVWKARTGQVSHAQKGRGWHRAHILKHNLHCWPEGAVLLVKHRDSTTGKLAVYRPWVAFSLGRTALTWRGRHLVYSTRLAGEIQKTHCCLQQPGVFTAGGTHCAPCLELCGSFFTWELLNVFLLSWTIAKKWGGGVHSSYLSLRY